MQFQQPFDARQVEPASFAPPPPLADYHVRITDSEAKPTKDNQGGYLGFQIEILDPGPYLNRKIPHNLNLFHANPQTVEIAYRQLSALCYVTNVFQIQDSRQLHGIPFIATIGPQKDNPQYSNVFAVKDINGNLPGKTASPVATVPAAAPPAVVPAWAPPGQPAAAAWGPPAPAVAPAPAWAPPPAAAAPPVWAPPGQPAAAQPAPPAWQPGAPVPAAPPWAK